MRSCSVCRAIAIFLCHYHRISTSSKQALPRGTATSILAFTMGDTSREKTSFQEMLDQNGNTEPSDPFTDDPSMGISYHYHHLGVSRGIAAGEVDGWRDGYTTGLRQGAQLASEMGYYEGFTRTWMSILEQTPTADIATTRKVTALKTLLETCNAFPRETKHIKEDDDVKQKLVRIRAKYRQVRSLVLGSRGKSCAPSWGSKFVEDSSHSTPPDIDF